MRTDRDVSRPDDPHDAVGAKLRLLSLGQRVRGLLPRTIAVWIAERVGDICWMVLRRHRRTIASNLLRTAADRTPADRRRLCRATFRNFAVCLSDFLSLPRATVPSILTLLTYEGLEHLDAAITRGRGAILVTPHVGSPEFAGFLMASHGYRLHAVVENLPPALLERFNRFRSAGGVNLIRLGRAFEARAVIKRGEILGVLADRAIGRGRSLAVGFAGGRRILPIGPAALALASGAPLLVASIALDTTRPGHRYIGIIEPEISTTDLGDQPAAQLTRRIAERLSHHVTRYPDQWFVFQPDWLDHADVSTVPRQPGQYA